MNTLNFSTARFDKNLIYSASAWREPLGDYGPPEVGALYVTFGADGTCSSVREVQQVRLFQKAFVRTSISSGRWSVRNGTLTLTITASIHPERVNKQLPFSVRSISKRDFIFVDYLGRVGQATKVP